MKKLCVFALLAMSIMSVASRSPRVSEGNGMVEPPPSPNGFHSADDFFCKNFFKEKNYKLNEVLKRTPAAPTLADRNDPPKR